MSTSLNSLIDSTHAFSGILALRAVHIERPLYAGEKSTLPHSIGVLHDGLRGDKRSHESDFLPAGLGTFLPVRGPSGYLSVAVINLVPWRPERRYGKNDQPWVIQPS